VDLEPGIIIARCLPEASAKKNMMRRDNMWDEWKGKANGWWLMEHHIMFEEENKRGKWTYFRIGRYQPIDSKHGN
jgi:hypothetical protein